MTRTAYYGARIFDGELWWDRSALVVNGDCIENIIAADSPTDARRVALNGGILAPGFIDLQVNGGGGALFNLTPDVPTIETICSAFTRFGTTACLPTLITDTREKNVAAIAAGEAAATKGVRGFLGLHIEGPHLAISRKGAHDPKLIRPMDDGDLLALIDARRRLPNLLTTVAAETVTPEQIGRLHDAGLVVSIGHSDAPYAMVKAAADAGATMVTHLFNAQSQIGNRDPGTRQPHKQWSSSRRAGGARLAVAGNNRQHQCSRRSVELHQAACSARLNDDGTGTGVGEPVR